MWVAPNSLAHSSLRSSMSTATIVDAPASVGPAMAASPTPPQPNTATVLPRRDAAGVDRRADAGHHAAAEQPGGRRRRRRVDLRALPGGDQRLVGEGADAERRRQHGAVGAASSSGWRCGWRSSTTARPRRQARHSPHTARQLRITKSPGATSVTPVADGLDDPGRLVAEQERELVVDAALAVVQVGVADPARLDRRRRPRPGPGRGPRSSRC